ncbi:MAG TPA: hypothetical protein VIK14_02285 [Ignavibacteria bacterium]
MPLSWNEIKNRAIKFSKERENVSSNAIDLCYRPQPFPKELSRLEFLFDLYKKYTTPMFAEGKKKMRNKN